MSIILTCLTDNRALEGFQAEFGLSLLLEAYGKRLLFDTGSGGCYLSNAKRLGIDLSDLTGVILSHGHYDHTTGLGLAPFRLPVYSGPHIEAPCCSLHKDGEKHWLTMPEASQQAMADHHEIGCFTEIYPGIYLTGPIPRISGEDTGGNFYCDQGCTQAHTVMEEQALLLKSGLLITGCCHAGIINTIEHCRKMAPEIPIRMIAGGLHLLHADAARLARTVNYLRTMKLERLLLLHCTGEQAGEYLKNNLDCQVEWGAAGGIYAFEK